MIVEDIQKTVECDNISFSKIISLYEQVDISLEDVLIEMININEQIQSIVCSIK